MRAAELVDAGDSAHGSGAVPIEGPADARDERRDRGEPDVAYMQARATRDARESCLSQGLPPQTPDYRHCVTDQIGKRIR